MSKGPLSERGQAALLRYEAAAHAMQSGVALAIGRGEARECEPKHLRVGINSSMVDSASLAQLLIAKGVISEDEYLEAIADGMEREAESYRKRLDLPPNVRLA